MSCLRLRLFIAPCFLAATALSSAADEGASPPPLPSFAPAISEVAEAVVTIVNLEEAPEEKVKEFKALPEALRRRVLSAGSWIMLEGKLYAGMGHGSGAVVDAKGHIITNEHVVAATYDEDSGDMLGGDAYAVIVGSGRDFVPAKLVGADASTDIAVIQIAAEHVKDTVESAEISKLRVGDIVLAVGAPRDIALRQTATMGIISAMGRSKNKMLLYENYIQTDAPTNPGNSGGPLVDVTGKVVGFNQSIRLSSVSSTSGGGVGMADGHSGIGFAVPANLAFAIKDQIVKHGKAVRGFLGIRMRELSDEEMKAMEDSVFPGGAVVEEIVKGTPAAGSEISSGDVIVQFGEHAITDASQLRLLTSLTPPGERVKIHYRRDGEIATDEIEVANLGESEHAEFGFKQESTPLEGLEFGVRQRAILVGFGRSTNLLQVTAVKPGSNAAEAGLEPGQLILRVNGLLVSEADQLAHVVKTTNAKQVLLTIREMDGEEKNIAFSFVP